MISVTAFRGYRAWTPKTYTYSPPARATRLSTASARAITARSAPVNRVAIRRAGRNQTVARRATSWTSRSLTGTRVSRAGHPIRARTHWPAGVDQSPATSRDRPAKNPRYRPARAASNVNVVNTPRKLARITPLKYPAANTVANPSPRDRTVPTRATTNAARGKTASIGQIDSGPAEAGPSP